MERIGRAMPYADFIRAFTHIFTPVPGTASLVRHLKRNGYRVQLLSNTSALDYAYFKNFPAFRLMDSATLSFKVGAKKPDKRIYADALKKARCRPEECVYADDIPEYVAAAKKLGIKAVVFRNAKQFSRELRKLGVQI
jgi:putative hydrolase of the HAD superfamily